MDTFPGQRIDVGYPVSENLPLARFLSERSPSSGSSLERRVFNNQQNLPPRLRIIVNDFGSPDEASAGVPSIGVPPPERPDSTGTSMMMSGNASLPALQRSSVGSLRSRGSRSSWSVQTPGPVEQGVPLLPLTAQTEPGGTHGQVGSNSREPPPIFECPFIDLHCHQKFSRFGAWLSHSVEHFGHAMPPSVNRCVFCREVFHAGSGMASWHDKLVCTAQHHVHEGAKLETARPDDALYRYLWEKSCITTAEWKELGQLRTERQRRGNAGNGAVSGYAAMSPPTSPRDKVGGNEQDGVVMTTNRRRDRHDRERERRNREMRELESRFGPGELI